VDGRGQGASKRQVSRQDELIRERNEANEKESKGNFAQKHSRAGTSRKCPKGGKPLEKKNSEKRCSRVQCGGDNKGLNWPE